MAKKKISEAIDSEEVESVVEQVEEAEVIEVIEVVVEEPIVAPTEAPTITPTIEEVVYNPKDIVEFYNNKGDLRYAPYAYISKRGYVALRKYTKKK
jgi:hypothetical protein